MRLAAARKRFRTPLDLAEAIEPTVRRTPALTIIDDMLAAAMPGDRFIVTMAPQEGKSWEVSRWLPNWWLINDPRLRVGMISYDITLARRNSRGVRNDILAHPEFGLELSGDTAAQEEWVLNGYPGGIIARGVGGGLTGRPLDRLVVDDPLKGQKEADSETYRDDVWEWWQSTGSPRLGPGSIVVVVMTRWHEDDFVGRILASEDAHRWKYINVPAQCESEVDILGRQIGEYMDSARGRTAEEWDQRKRDAGSRAWNALYQGRPAPAEGGIFKREWWRFHHFPPMIDAYGRAYVPGVEEYQIHVDATFKDTSKSDFVCMQVWGRQGAKARLLDQVHGRMDYPTTRDALVGLCAKWPAARARYIEDKANGPAIIAELGKSLGGMIAVNPKDSKEARAHAVTPYIEAGDVELPDPSFAPWVNDFIEEASAFPNGAHDDQVDAMTQALDKMLGSSRGLQGALEALHGLRRVA